MVAPVPSSEMITDTESGIVNVGILGSLCPLSSLLALLWLVGPLAVALLFFKVALEFVRFVELERWLEWESVGDPAGFDIFVELARVVELDMFVEFPRFVVGGAK
jgi:hypothetical protein